MPFILSIDQGTTSTRALIFDENLSCVASSQEEVIQYFPQSGWVEHDPMNLLQTVISTVRDALKKAHLTAKDIVTIGITNQRETTVVWDKTTGQPVGNAIVWQDRRTFELCQSLAQDTAIATSVREETGLLLDSYFSSTKILWILNQDKTLRARAENGDILFGTVDTWLIWNLTGGQHHVTDATNAARTMMYNIHTGRWSEQICQKLTIPMAMLPQVKDCSADFGRTVEKFFGARIPINGVAGDQQAATVGQACFQPGMLKSTYGTGCFALLNIGKKAVLSKNQLLTTIAYQLNGTPTYALEGSIFIAGAVVQWLRDAMGFITHADQVDTLAHKASTQSNIIIVPAFTGMGVPYWNSQCRGAIFGLTRDTGPRELARAALESVGFQTCDLIEAMKADLGGQMQTAMRVDGGMSVSKMAMQFVSDICNIDVQRSINIETTALGAAWLAGTYEGIVPDMSTYERRWKTEHHYTPNITHSTRVQKYEKWKSAVSATLSF